MSTIAPAAGGERRFGSALAASLAIHVAVMTLSLPAPRLAALEAPARLQVRLAELQPPLPSAEPKKPFLPVALKPKAPKAPQAIKAPKVTEAVAEAPTPVAAPAPETEAVAEAPTPVGAPIPEPKPVVPATTSPPRPVAVYTPVPPAPQVSTAELLASYTKTVSQALARYKKYPRIAQMRGWEGAVMLELRLAPSGRLLGAGLHTSSGYPMLDEQALAMAARVGQFPAPPEGLSSADMAVLLPIVFRLTP
jgi:protein TonB